MKILHLSESPLSNAPKNLATIQCAAGHEATVLLGKQTNTNNVHVGGELWCGYSFEALRILIQWADVIHFHNFAWEQSIFRQHPELIEICQRFVPCLIQYHSPRNSNHNFDVTINDPFFRKRRAVVAQYQVRQYPEADYIVPNVLPIFDQAYLPLASKPGITFTVSYAPSNVNLKGWDDKGYEHTSTVLRRLERECAIQADIICNTPYQETLLRKKWADVGIDEVATGSYHLSFLEYMSMGVLACANMDDATKAAMSFVVGWDAVHALPHINANKMNLEGQLRDLIRSRDEVKSRGMACRKWMEEHWNPTKLSKYFEDIYAKL